MIGKWQTHELPEYPTPEQIKEIWEAYKSGKQGAIEEVLRRRSEERQAQTSQPEDGTGPDAPQK